MLTPKWIILPLLSLAACGSLGDSFHVTPFLREQITGDTWRACLAREYQAQTRVVLREGREWAEASRFSAKGWAALRNETVSPWQVSQFELTEGRASRLSHASGDLSSALAKKDLAPCACAKAQGAFDGWLAASARFGADEAGLEKNYANAIAACRKGDTRRVEAQ
jgi:hypothetical protein